MKYSRVRAVHRSKSGPPMSALGQKQISPFTDAMSALPPKVDKQRTSRYVRFVPEADSCAGRKKGDAPFRLRASLI